MKTLVMKAVVVIVVGVFLCSGLYTAEASEPVDMQVTSDIVVGSEAIRDYLSQYNIEGGSIIVDEEEEEADICISGSLTVLGDINLQAYTLKVGGNFSHTDTARLIAASIVFGTSSSLLQQQLLPGGAIGITSGAITDGSIVAYGPFKTLILIEAYAFPGRANYYDENGTLLKSVIYDENGNINWKRVPDPSRENEKPARVYIANKAGERIANGIYDSEGHVSAYALYNPDPASLNLPLIEARGVVFPGKVKQYGADGAHLRTIAFDENGNIAVVNFLDVQRMDELPARADVYDADGNMVARTTYDSEGNVIISATIIDVEENHITTRKATEEELNKARVVLGSSVSSGMTTVNNVIGGLLTSDFYNEEGALVGRWQRGGNMSPNSHEWYEVDSEGNLVPYLSVTLDDNVETNPEITRKATDEELSKAIEILGSSVVSGITTQNIAIGGPLETEFYNNDGVLIGKWTRGGNAAPGFPEWYMVDSNGDLVPAPLIAPPMDDSITTRAATQDELNKALEILGSSVASGITTQNIAIGGPLETEFYNNDGALIGKWTRGGNAAPGFPEWFMVDSAGNIIPAIMKDPNSIDFIMDPTVTTETVTLSNINVNGNLTLNTDKAVVFDGDVNVSGELNFSSNTEYDIYVEGDLTVDGPCDLNGASLYVTGNLTISDGASLDISNPDSQIICDGSLNITTGEQIPTGEQLPLGTIDGSNITVVSGTFGCLGLQLDENGEVIGHIVNPNDVPETFTETILPNSPIYSSGSVCSSVIMVNQSLASEVSSKIDTLTEAQQASNIQGANFTMTGEMAVNPSLATQNQLQ